MLTHTDNLFDHSCRPDPTEGVCRSRGGESCAFDGAMIVLQCIADSAHLVHGPIACFGNSWESRGTLSDKGSLHKRAYTTDLDEVDIVYGAEEKLFEAILQTWTDSRAKAIFVYSTCVTGLTGEDIQTVCHKAAVRLGISVIPVEAPGFVGPKNLGNRIAGEVLLERVVGTGQTDDSEPAHINLIGEYNIAGDLYGVEPLLKKAGISIGARITGNATFEEITRAHGSRLNMLVCSRALINLARGMEQRYGIPYMEGSFFGSTEVSSALRRIAGHIEEVTRRQVGKQVEEVILEQETLLAERLRPFRYLKGKRAVLYSGGVKSWAMISALMDLGIDVAAVGTKKATREDEEKMRDLLGEDAPLYESMTPARILSLMKEKDADMLIAGGRNLYLGIKEGFPFVDVNQERHRAYAGYDGLVNLARSIHQAFRFYEGRSHRGPGPVIRNKREVSIDPLKHSPALGAAMALQGIDKALPILHGAQGCNFLGKVLLTKHFREPIALVSSKLFVENVVMGGREVLKQVLDEAIEKQAPELIALLTTGLSEVKGDHLLPLVREARTEKTEVIHISTPDYEGGLEEGYAKALCRLSELAVPQSRVPGQVNVLTGSHLTPADIMLLKVWFTSFGLTARVLPDLSALDGSKNKFQAMAVGGTPMEAVRSMGASERTVAIGLSAAPAAKVLKNLCGIPWTTFESLSGQKSVDRFFSFLEEFSGHPIPDGIGRERRILVDGKRDAQFAFGGKKIAVAQEADHALQTVEWLNEMGVEEIFVVVPTAGPSAERIQADQVVVGDYGAVPCGYDLLISNSHGEEVARRLGMKHYPMGFPIVERLGANAAITVGYGGTLNLLNNAGNRLIGGE